MKTRTILGVPFFCGPPAEAVDAGMRGGLVVVPSAPVLVGIETDAALREAVIGADLAITDSGLMVLLWWLLTGEKLERVSGLEYLKLLLAKPELRQPGAVLWVMPSAEARSRNLAWLQTQGYATTAADCYLAPLYGAGPLQDEALITLVRQRRPAHIILALGGGVQERLGWFLKHELETTKSPAAPLLSPETPGYVLKPASSSAVPGIHCIGAAIGFLSGEQVRIPMWVDYLYLGWLWRSISAPGKFIPRYWKACRLVALLVRWRDKAPVDRAAGGKN